MAKLGVLLMIFSLLAAMAWAQGSKSKVKNWATKARHEAPKETVTTHLQFYFHDVFSGKNPTAIMVAQPNVTEKFPTMFGTVVMIDDPLTETPDPNSKLLGRAQGLYGSAGQQEMGLIMAMSLEFIDGIYNGSTINIFGRNPAMHPVRELPIVSGTGLFRLARGYAIAQTYSFNPTNGDAVVGYNVTVFH